MQLEVRTGGHPERSGEERATQSKDPGLIRRCGPLIANYGLNLRFSRDPSTSALRASAQDDSFFVEGGIKTLSPRFATSLQL
jgi:hypothetical protein